MGMTISFALSYRDVKELLTERGLDFSHETVRRWVGSLRFLGAMACAAPALAAETISVMIDKRKIRASASLGPRRRYDRNGRVAMSSRIRRRRPTKTGRRHPGKEDRLRHAAAGGQRRLLLSLSPEHERPNFGGARVRKVGVSVCVHGLCRALR